MVDDLPIFYLYYPVKYLKYPIFVMVIFHGYVTFPNDKSLVSVRFRYPPMISWFFKHGSS